MSSIFGKVGAWHLEFRSAPRGAEGEVEVRANPGAAPAGEWVRVKWRMDEQGIWVEGPGAIAGYDFEGERGEDGVLRYRLLQRGGSGEYAGLSLRRAGETESSAAQVGGKNLKVRSQMPGKIVRVLVKQGDSVKKGDPLLVMEAMKMENEIRAVHPGVVKAVSVSPGQAVETGADLVLMEGS